jgi:hypothetical protein
MMRLNLSILLALLDFAQAGQAGPLDTWAWRNPLPTGNNLSSVAYGNGLFAAVGDSGTIVTSADGLNWTLRQWGGDFNLCGIIFGNGRFVVVGELAPSRRLGPGPGTILTSTNGVSWFQQSPGTNGTYPSSITFGNGRFVAVGPGTIMTSTDGVAWVVRASSRQASAFSF